MHRYTVTSNRGKKTVEAHSLAEAMESLNLWLTHAPAKLTVTISPITTVEH